MTRRMPAEWEAHERTWMLYPPAVYGGGDPARARVAWGNVARTISGFEPVSMGVRAEDFDRATAELGDDVDVVVMDLDDAWARDVAPTFVKDDDDVVAVDWNFNGWGQQHWARWENDDLVAGTIARHLGVRTVRSSIVNEGGGIEVNGAGTVIVTTTVQLDDGRNGPEAKIRVERELSEQLGVDRVIWLDRGLAGDYEDFGTRGHVDLLAKFVSEDLCVVHEQRNVEHPDYETSRAIRARLEQHGINTVGLVAPERIDVDGRLCDWSYVNCSFVNGALVVGVYDDPADDAALSVLASLCPDREIVAVPARELFALGGGVHCITQQQPSRGVA